MIQHGLKTTSFTNDKLIKGSVVMEGIMNRSESESFINYMKTMREYHKPTALNPKPLPKDFNFDYIEDDASSYGFITNPIDTNNVANSLASSSTNNISSDISDSSNGSDNDDSTANICQSQNTSQSKAKNKHHKDIVLKSSQITISSQLDQQKTPVATDITTIELFEHDDSLVNGGRRPAQQKKSTQTITEKIAAAVANFFK